MTTFEPLTTRSTIRVGFARTDSEWADAGRLVGELVDWLARVVQLDAQASQHDSTEELSSLRDFYSTPAGSMVLGYVNGIAAGTSGVHMMDAETAELRRVWVTPSARGAGIAPLMLESALQAARELGARRVWLETAADHMQKAITMYTRAGFRPISDYSDLRSAVPSAISLGLDLY